MKTKNVTMTKPVEMMNSMKQNSILLKGRFNHHESDQHWMTLQILTGIIPECGTMSLLHAIDRNTRISLLPPSRMQRYEPMFMFHQTALTTTVEWGSCDEPSSNTECCDKVAHACVTNAMFRHELCTCSRDSRILSSKRMYFTRRQQRGPLTYHLCERRRIDKSRKRCFSLRHSSGRGDCGLTSKRPSSATPWRCVLRKRLL